MSHEDRVYRFVYLKLLKQLQVVTLSPLVGSAFWWSFTEGSTVSYIVSIH